MDMSQKTDVTTRVLEAACSLSSALAPLYASLPWGKAHYALDPTVYGWGNYEAYVRRAASGPRVGLIVGMNPGPHGMAQTAVPFGDVTNARAILGGVDRITRRPELDAVGWSCKGLDYHRGEVSGQRLWGALSTIVDARPNVRGDDMLVKALGRVYVLNYCPLLFLDDGGCNITPDDLPRGDPRTVALEEACDRHLHKIVAALGASRILALGRYTERACRRALFPKDAFLGGVSEDLEVRYEMHPSPRNDARSGGWLAGAAPSLVWALGLDGAK